MDRRVSVLIASALLALGIIAFMLFRVWGDILASMGHWVPAYLLPATAFCTAGWLLRGARYQYILRGLEAEAGFWFSTACVLISQTVNLIVPARLGDLVRIFILKHEDLCDYPTGLSSLVIERFFDILTVALLGLIALPFIPGVPPWVFPVIVIPLVLCTVFVVVLLAFGKVESENRYLAILLSMIREMKKASLTPASLLGLTGLSVAIWAMDVLATLSIAAMFQASIGPGIVLLAVVVGNLAKAVPVTPGGIGTYEAALAVIFVLSGTEAATATLIAITDHLLKNVITVAGGILSIRLLGGWVVDAMRSAYRGKGKEEEPRGD
jgi:glycosyltransferase AglD